MWMPNPCTCEKEKDALECKAAQVFIQFVLFPTPTFQQNCLKTPIEFQFNGGRYIALKIN